MSKIIKYFKGEVRNIDPNSFTAEVVISNETIDRYRERILVSAFRKTIPEFMKHPVLLSSHAYRGLMNQIGEFESLKISHKNKEVSARPKWYVGEGNPEADWGWKLAEKGKAAFSVGFISRESVRHESEEEIEKNEGSERDYMEIDLLEVSQVLVPANPAALQKSFNEEEDPFLKEYYEEILKIASDIFETKKQEGQREEGSPEEIIEQKKWEETENEIRHRVKDPGLFSKFRYISIKKDKPRVFAVLGKWKNPPTEGSAWAIQALRFPKVDGWTMSSAKEWVSKHPDVVKDIIWEESFFSFEVFEEFDSFEELDQKVFDYEIEKGLSEDVETLKEFYNTLEGEVKELRKEVASLREIVLSLKKEEVPDVVPIGDVVGEDKLKEMEDVLRQSLGMQTTEEEEAEIVLHAQGIFDDMHKDMRKIFSVQPKGNEQ
jgi:hypothetical protein